MCSNTLLFGYCKHSLMKQHLDQLQWWNVINCIYSSTLSYFTVSSRCLLYSMFLCSNVDFFLSLGSDFFKITIQETTTCVIILIEK